MKKVNKLTVKQQRFIDLYDGNGTQTAIKAGYSKKTAYAIAIENLKKPIIIDAIRAREIKKTAKKIATREERQAFWTEVMLDKEESMVNRLRAAELLGKSEADFIDRHEHTVKEYKFEEFAEIPDEELINEIRSLGCRNEN